MKLNDGHIAYRFLTDKKFWWEIIEAMFSQQDIEQMAEIIKQDGDIASHKPSAQIATLHEFLNPRDNKNYFITSTVIDKLDILKVQRKDVDGEMEYDWKVFNHLSDRKVTFILPDNRLFRMEIAKDDIRNRRVIYFMFLKFTFAEGSDNLGHAHWDMFFIDQAKGRLDDESPKAEVRKYDTLIYKILCFMYLSENEELTIAAGGKHGTRKSGKVVNQLPFPVTIVTSKWNITSVRTEGFWVSAHLAIRWTGAGRTIPRMVLIEPFEKHGYVRRAAKEGGL